MVKFLNGKTDLNHIEIVLTDFGLVGLESKGGTPIFASPECLANKERKNNPDIFSLGRVFLFTITARENFLEFLYVPVTDAFNKCNIEKIIENEPILKLISSMMQIKNRTSLKNIQKGIQFATNMNPQTSICLISRIICQSSTDLSNLYIKNLRKIS